MMHQSTRDLQPRRFDPTLLLAFLLPIFAWAPLTYPGYFVFRSGFLPVFNLSERLARLGDFAWTPDVGGSYSLLTGEGSLPYALAAIPAAIGVNPLDAVKVLLALSFIAGSVGTYLWMRRRLGDRWPALVAAAVYVFNPIFLSSVYTLGAIAEVVFLGLAPWVLWAADGALEGRRGAAIALALLSALTIWTQAGLALSFLIVIGVYLLVVWRTEGLPGRALALPVLGLLVGLILGVLGLAPVFAQRGFGAPGWPMPQWSILLTPWLALLGGWIAARLAAMIPEQNEGDRLALFAALIGLVLLIAYPSTQPVATAEPVPSAPLAIFGENEIALLSVQTEGTPGPGGRVTIDVTWQALRPIKRDYTVFFHVIAGDDRRYGQLDTMPQGGELPTTQWQPGEVIRDRYEAVVSPDAPLEGDYRYWLGWYLGANGERLPAGRDDKHTVQP
jgi:hypothetical protein